MSDDIFQGYKGAGFEVLKKFNVRVWGQAEVLTTRGLFKGRFCHGRRTTTTSTSF